MISVVLIHPEIPPNTGNIGRLCCAVHAPLHLVKPLGFRLDDRSLKRAGLDYWRKLELVVWEDLESYLTGVRPDQLVLTGSKRGEAYHIVPYKPDDHILFGPETKGLPVTLFERFPQRVARIPIYLDRVRSLNLSTAAGVVVCEALRATDQLPH